MKDRELEDKVLRFVRELGIATGSKVRKVGFDLAGGVVTIDTGNATYVAPADSLWSDYADNEARMKPEHATLIPYPTNGRSPTQPLPT